MNNQDVKLINCSGSVWPLQTSHTLLIPPADPVKSSVRVNLRPSGRVGAELQCGGRRDQCAGPLQSPPPAAEY